MNLNVPPRIELEPGESLCSERILNYIDSLNKQADEETIDRLWSMEFPEDE